MNTKHAIAAAGLVVAAALAYVAARPAAPPPVPPPEFAGPDVPVGAVRCAAKDVVVRDLIAGRRSLDWAAAAFGWLNDLDPAVRVEEWRLREGPDAALVAGEQYTPDELLRAEVVLWVGRVAGEECPDRLPELRRALMPQVRDTPGVPRDGGFGEADRRELFARGEAEARRWSHPHEVLGAAGRAPPTGPAAAPAADGAAKVMVSIE